MDFAAPIIVNGELLGCFIGGQVLKEAPDPAYIQTIASEIGVDPDEYPCGCPKNSDFKTTED